MLTVVAIMKQIVMVLSYQITPANCLQNGIHAKSTCIDTSRHVVVGVITCIISIRFLQCKVPDSLFSVKVRQNYLSSLNTGEHSKQNLKLKAPTGVFACLPQG